MMFRQFLSNLSLLIKMKGRKYALNMNARRCELAALRLPAPLSVLSGSTIKSPLLAQSFIMFMVVLGNT